MIQETIMAKAKEVKTNAMRILDRMKISYQTYTYECDEFVDGKQTADLLGFPHEIMFKTLVTVSPKGDYFVFAIPIDDELDLKKAARAAAAKSLAMIHVKEINAVTGYIRGGCTAIGMKKNYPVFMHESALSHERIIVSGGKIGAQIELTPQDYEKACGAVFTDLIKE
jgi:Cys-tRNA(Pro)/Cys-tRNA(Cys) deacylase